MANWVHCRRCGRTVKLSEKNAAALAKLTAARCSALDAITVHFAFCGNCRKKNDPQIPTQVMISKMTAHTVN